MREATIPRTSGVSDIDEYLKKSISIEATQLVQEFTDVASEVSYWNEQYADALRVSLHAKIARERKGAELLFVERMRLSAAAPKERITEAMVDAATELNSEYQTLRNDEADSSADAVRMKGITEAVRTKRDMLVSLGAHIRAELHGDPSIRRLDSDDPILPE